MPLSTSISTPPLHPPFIPPPQLAPPHAPLLLPQVGNTTDGGFGPGWIQDTQDDDLYEYDPKLLESIAGDVAEDKLEESEDKEAILGDDMLNPHTGEWGG